LNTWSICYAKIHTGYQTSINECDSIEVIQYEFSSPNANKSIIKNLSKPERQINGRTYLKSPIFSLEGLCYV
jgi:hypothetical protein